MEEWKTYKLGDVCEYKHEFVPVENINIENYISTENMIANKGGITFSSNLPTMGNVTKYQKGDILISNIRPYFRKIWHADRNGGCSSDVLCIKSKNNINDTYLYYLLSQQDFFNYVMSGVKGCKMPRGDKQYIMQWDISIPRLKEQIQIANILSSLDDKIEINHKINENLEQQFKNLYIEWFSKNSKGIFNNVPLSEIIFFQEGPGIRNWQYVEKDGVKFINIRCINDGDIDVTTANMISTKEAFGKYKHFMLDEFDIVMSCSGTLGRYAIVRSEHLPLCLNTSVIRFKPKQQFEDYSFIYGFLTSQDFLHRQEELACGSVQANFGPTHLKNMVIKEYPKKYRKEFHKLSFPLLLQILRNRKENDNLFSLRDALLPKLISGKLQIQGDR